MWVSSLRFWEVHPKSKMERHVLPSVSDFLNTKIEFGINYHGWEEKAEIAQVTSASAISAFKKLTSEN